MTEGEAAVPEEFRRLARDIFGETEGSMEGLTVELREAIREEGLLIPGENNELQIVIEIRFCDTFRVRGCY